MYVRKAEQFRSVSVDTVVSHNRKEGNYLAFKGSSIHSILIRETPAVVLSLPSLVVAVSFSSVLLLQWCWQFCFGREIVDGHTAFPFQTEDVVWISDLMVTSFELLNRKASILPTFIPLVKCTSCEWTLYVRCWTVISTYWRQYLCLLFCSPQHTFWMNSNNHCLRHIFFNCWYQIPHVFNGCATYANIHVDFKRDLPQVMPWHRKYKSGKLFKR